MAFWILIKQKNGGKSNRVNDVFILKITTGIESNSISAIRESYFELGFRKKGSYYFYGKYILLQLIKKYDHIKMTLGKTMDLNKKTVKMKHFILE